MVYRASQKTHSLSALCFASTCFPSKDPTPMPLKEGGEACRYLPTRGLTGIEFTCLGKEGLGNDGKASHGCVSTTPLLNRKLEGAKLA